MLKIVLEYNFKIGVVAIKLFTANSMESIGFDSYFTALDSYFTALDGYFTGPHAYFTRPHAYFTGPHAYSTSLLEDSTGPDLN